MVVFIIVVMKKTPIFLINYLSDKNGNIGMSYRNPYNALSFRQL